MHDVGLRLGVALYVIRHWSRFGKNKPRSSVSIAQLASLAGVCSPDPITVVELNYSIWLSIDTALEFGTGSERLACLVMSAA